MKLYFEEKGEQLLKMRGMKKAEFARRLGIHKQNVNVTFGTKNILVLRKAAEILEVPFELLVSYVTEPDIANRPLEELVSQADGTERARQVLEEVRAKGLSDGELRWLAGRLSE